MNTLDELKQVVANQKSISTSKLLRLLKNAEKMYIQQGLKINRQEKALSQANATIQKLNVKIERRKEMVQQLENLKTHHRNLTREYNLLLEKLKNK